MPAGVAYPYKVTLPPSGSEKPSFTRPVMEVASGSLERLVLLQHSLHHRELPVSEELHLAPFVFMKREVGLAGPPLTGSNGARSLEIVGTVNRIEFGSIICASRSAVIRLDAPNSAKSDAMIIFINRMPFSTCLQLRAHLLHGSAGKP